MSGSSYLTKPRVPIQLQHPQKVDRQDFSRFLSEMGKSHHSFKQWTGFFFHLGLSTFSPFILRSQIHSCHYLLLDLEANMPILLNFILIYLNIIYFVQIVIYLFYFKKRYHCNVLGTGGLHQTWIYCSSFLNSLSLI